MIRCGSGLYYLHRRDETVPLEDAIGTLVDLMKEGKIGGYGLSEVAPPCVWRKTFTPVWQCKADILCGRVCRDRPLCPFSPWRAVFLAKPLWRKQIFAPQLWQLRPYCDPPMPGQRNRLCPCQPGISAAII